MPKKFHLAQYTMLPVTHHSMATWKHPRNLAGGWRFDRPDVWQYLAQVCERGKFDFFFSADTEGIYEEYHKSHEPAVRYAAQVPCYDVSAMMAWKPPSPPISVLCLPYRWPDSPRISWPANSRPGITTWDHMSNGRAGVNILTAFHLSAAKNLGLDPQAYHYSHDTRYDRAAEYLEVCYQLWDSWEEDAVVMDVANNMFADPTKVHPTNFEGQWFSVAGPLNINCSPQGKPLIVQAGQSERGQEFAARHAEAVFSIQWEVAGMKRYYDSLKDKMLKQGRNPDSLKVFFGVQPIVGETAVRPRGDSLASIRNPLCGPYTFYYKRPQHVVYTPCSLACIEEILGRANILHNLHAALL